MAMATTTNPSDFANNLQTYFNPKFLEALKFELVLADYAWRKPFPIIGNTVRFFRPRQANTTGVAALAEATVPTTLTEVARGYVDITLSQRGALAKISDIVQAQDLIDTLALYTKTMGADAALDFDGILRAAIVSGLKTYNTASSGAKYAAAYGYFERFGAVTPTDGAPATDFASLVSGSAASQKMTRTLHLGALTTLKANRVPMIGGKYVAAIAPEVMHDVRQDTTWVTAATRVDTQNLYKRGTIELDGAVFVEHNNSHRESDTYGTYNATGGVFSNLYFGEGAFGVPELSAKQAGGGGMNPNIIVITKPDHSNPLSQWVTLGWKAFYGAALLVTNEATDKPRVLNLRTKSTFV